MKKILIISHDKIGASMAGPGIRYHYMATVLSKNFDVTIGFFNKSFLPEKNFHAKYKKLFIDINNFESKFKDYSTVIALWLNDSMLEFCNRNAIFLVFDIYAPTPVENLALFMFNGKKIDNGVDYEYQQSFSMYEKYFSYGDLFLFSNRRQMNFWAGYVFGSGKVTVSRYTKRPFFERFIYAPMGIDCDQSLRHTKKVAKGVIKGIEKDDLLLLWTGGIWNWYDAETLIYSMSEIYKLYPKVKLLFFGTKHPNPNIPEMQESIKAYTLAKKLNLIDKNVFIHDAWVPYEERINFLLEADIAINTSKVSIESEFSHRTRVLDHLLACLPTIATEGDFLTDEYIKNKNLGISVPAYDHTSVINAVELLIDENERIKIKNNIKKIRNDFDWKVTLGALEGALLDDMPKLSYIKPARDNSKFLQNRFAKKLGKNLPPALKQKILKGLKK